MMQLRRYLLLLCLLVTMLACGLVQPGGRPPTFTAPAPVAPPIETPVFAPPPGFASLSELQGGVEARQPTDADFLTAVAGMFLPDLSQVRTAQDGRARLDLSTGSIVRVTPNSLFTLTVKDPAPQSLWLRFKLFAGQLYVILRGGSVEVETPSGVATVRGSFMSVMIDRQTGDALVQCLEGDCRLETPAGIFSLSTGRAARMRFSAPGAKPLPPLFDILTENDLQTWLQINPETGEVREKVRRILQLLRPGERLPLTVAPEGAAPGVIISTPQP